MFLTVQCPYGNNFDEVCEAFLSNGWCLKSKVDPDYNTGKKNLYLTFESGEPSFIPDLSLINAHILKSEFMDRYINPEPVEITFKETGKLGG